MPLNFIAHGYKLKWQLNTEREEVHKRVYRQSFQHSVLSFKEPLRRQLSGLNKSKRDTCKSKAIYRQLQYIYKCKEHVITFQIAGMFICTLISSLHVDRFMGEWYICIQTRKILEGNRI